ncbi:META domain-containing protein [Nostocoides sp. F2B08]|uniref:META domain-containing protein n=1 Tax=Nostocoides sp. F2B08 TaxID=2653936 RepID=UPI001262D367|nr:META domain-containing protein [Tetrasphaera sp. F2B08]KAB7745248.1 META domain-containing protein [Tetrasphaera sp. F2B08]
MTMPVHTTTGGLRRRALAVCALTALALAGCSGGGGGDAESAEPLDLEGKTFTATEVTGWVPVTGTTIQLTFEDGRVAGQAGCNTLTGGATWTADQLLLEGPMASTMMACERGLEAQDQWLIELLESDPRLSLDGGALVVGTDTNGMTMEES